MRTQKYLGVYVVLVGAAVLAGCQDSSDKEVENLEEQVQAPKKENQHFKANRHTIKKQRKAILNKKGRAVVRLKAITSAGKANGGSAVIIGPDGYIITCKHCIEGTNSIFVYLYSSSGKTKDKRDETRAKLIHIHETEDLALLKVNADMKLPVLEFGDSNVLKKEDFLFAMGYTGGEEMLTCTPGSFLKHVRKKKLIRSTLNTIRGNSGGATVTHEGKLVGMNASIVGGECGLISEAIGSNLIKKWAEDLIKKHRKANNSS